ncbi:hypothetical protein BsWGS_27972 [Bradybaena similaris]
MSVLQMRSLCFLAALMAAAMASPASQSVELEKRIGGIMTATTDAMLLKSLTSGLSGKTEQPEIYAEFARYPVDKLCRVCSRLHKAPQVSACKQYCQEKGRAGQK